MTSFWEAVDDQDWSFPPLEVICCFLGGPHHQCLRCPLALGCAGKCTAIVRNLAKNRRWPLCLSHSSPQVVRRRGRQDCHISLHCVDAERNVVFLRIGLHPKRIALAHHRAAQPERALLDEVQYTVRNRLKLGFQPTNNCSLSYLEKVAVTAALHGEVELSTPFIGGTPRVLRTACRFRRPHAQLRLLRGALGGRFHCFFCLSDSTHVGCHTCKRRVCRNCALPYLEQSKMCLGCVFSEHDDFLAHRTRGDRIRRDWYIGN